MKKIITVLLAFLLAGSLALLGGCLTVSAAIAPAMREGGTPMSAGILAREKELIREKVTELGGIYGFDPEPVIGYLDDSALETMNREGALWWNSVLAGGRLSRAPAPEKDGLVNILAADRGLMAGRSKTDREITADETAEAVRKTVSRVMLPIRQEAAGIGLQEAGKRIDIPNVLAFLVDLPWALLALTALLAGLIALVESRKLRFALPWIGSAMGAALLALLACAVLARQSGIAALIRESSESLMIQAEGLLQGALLRGGLFCAALLAGCVLCLVLCRRTGQKA